MAALNDIIVRIRADATQLQAGLQKAGAAVSGFASNVSSTQAPLAQMGAGTAQTEKATSGLFNAIGKNAGHLLAMGLGFAAFYRGLVLVNQGIDSVIGGFTHFDENMRNVQSLTKQTDGSLALTSQGILYMAASGESAGKSATDLSSAMYDIASAGFVGQQALDLLKISARGAGAGLTDTKTSAAALIAILYAYKRPVSDAQSIMDSLFRIVDLGIINFQQLTSTIGLVIPAAAAMHVSLDELGAGIVELTRQGQQPNRVMTNFNAVLTAILKPTKQAREQAKALGIDFSAAAVESKGFPAVLAEIAAKAGNNDTALAKMFGNVRAIRAIFPLAANGGKEYIAMLEQMGVAHEGAGATARALAEQQKSFMFQLRVVGSQLQAYLISGLRPVVIWMAQHLPAAASAAGRAFSVLTQSIGGVLSFLKDLHRATGGFSTALLVAAMAIRPLLAVLQSLQAAFWITGAQALALGAAEMEAVVAGAALTATELGLAEAEAAEAVAAAEAAVATEAMNAAGLSTLGWIGIAVAAIGALGFAYHWLKGRQKEARIESDEQIKAGRNIIETAMNSGTSLESLSDAEDQAGNSAADAGKAIQKELIEPLGKAPRLASDARYELGKLATQFSQVGEAASAIAVAEKALGDLYGSLAGINKAIQAESLGVIQETLAAVGGSPATYEAASAAVDQLSRAQGVLSTQVDDARQKFGDLDDTMKAQEKTLTEYQREADKINKSLDKVKQRIQDLNNTPIAGEAAYKEAKYQLDRQIQELQYALESLPDTPANKAQRANIQREIADLQHEQSRIDIEAARTIGEAQHQREMLELSLTKEVSGPTVLSAVKDAVQDQLDLTPAAQAANDKLQQQQDVVANLKQPWQDAKDRLDNLTSALTIVNTALDDFSTALKTAADFAVSQFNRIQKAAEDAGGAVSSTFVAPEAAAAPLMPNIAGFAQDLAANTKKLLAKGVEHLPEDWGFLVQHNVAGGFFAAKEAIGKDKSPEQLAEIVSKETLDALEQQFGTDWPLYRDALTDAVNKTIAGASGSPVLGVSMTDMATQMSSLYAVAQAEGWDEVVPDLQKGYLNAITNFVASVSVPLVDRLQAVRDGLASGVIPDNETLRQVLSKSDLPQTIVTVLTDGTLSKEEQLDALGRLIAQEPITGFTQEWVDNSESMVDAIAKQLGIGIGSAYDLLQSYGKQMGAWLAEGLSLQLVIDLADFFAKWKQQYQLFHELPTAAKFGWTPEGLTPGHQHGVRDWLGGLAMLGEGGRELAFLPRHSSVASAKDTAKIMDFLKSGGQQSGTIFSPQFDIHATGDSWDSMRSRILTMVSDYLDKAAAEAGIASPLIVHGVGMPRL